jgi:hypothetical protein
MKKLFFLLISIIGFTTCSKNNCFDPSNPACEGYDPCYGAEQPSAKFIMEESDGILRRLKIWGQDSIFKGVDIRFHSKFLGSKYKHTWYVENEIFTGDTTPYRFYYNRPRPLTITISHVIEYEPNLRCFPTDDGRDSVAQSFRLVESSNELKTFGTYRGVLQGSTDSFEVKIVSVDFDLQPAIISNQHGQLFINFHNRGDTLNSGFGGIDNIHMAALNKYGYFSTGLNGFVKIYDDDTFLMQYKNDRNSVTGQGDTVTYFYKGRKID